MKLRQSLFLGLGFMAACVSTQNPYPNGKNNAGIPAGNTPAAASSTGTMKSGSSGPTKPSTASTGTSTTGGKGSASTGGHSGGSSNGTTTTGSASGTGTAGTATGGTATAGNASGGKGTTSTTGTTGTSGSGTGGTGGTPSYRGTVSLLRQSTSIKNDELVEVGPVLVTANAGNGVLTYVSDPSGGEFSGIAIQRCAESDSLCQATPPQIGSEWTVVGTFTNDDGFLEITNATVTASDANDGPVYAMTVDALQVDETQTNNQSLYGSYVAVDTSQLPELVVQPLSDNPADGLINTAWLDPNHVDELNTLSGECGLNMTATSTANCCPSGIGPKYYGFVVSAYDDDGNDVADIMISDANYRDLNFTVWPCSSEDLQYQVIIPGTTVFTSIDGIFDYQYGHTQLEPTTTTDYTIQAGTVGGEGAPGYGYGN